VWKYGLRASQQRKDIPETQGDYWSERQGGYTGTNWMCGTRLCNGRIVHLGYWNSPSMINTSGLHGNITHEYPDEQVAFTEVKTRIFARTFELYPDAKLFYEPYGVWGYIKSIQNRSDRLEIFPPNKVLLSQENGDNLASDIEIWTDSRIYASGLVNRSNTMVTTPDTYDQYRNLRISATAMMNGGWTSHFGRFGGTDGTPNYASISVVPFDHKLIRAIPNWENENNVPLSDRHWDNASKVYYSPITYASMDVEYSKHPKNGNIYGVFSSINGKIVLPENNTAVAIYKADGLFRKDHLAIDDFTIDGNTIKLKSAANIDVGYIIITGVFVGNNYVNITAPPVNVTPANDTPVNSTPKINITIPPLESKYIYRCTTEVKLHNGFVFIKTKKMTKLTYVENYTEKMLPIIISGICFGEESKEVAIKAKNATIIKNNIIRFFNFTTNSFK
jgi:hypothetical protein